MTLNCVDELLSRVALGEPAPNTLTSASLGDIVTAGIDAALD